MDERGSILVVDDHSLTAEMTARYLESEADFKTSHRDSLPEAIDLIASDGGFDVVLLDLDMPGMNGLVGVEKVIAENKSGAVVIFSGQVRIEGALKAIELGAKGFIPKTLPLRSLANAIRFVLLGEIFLPPTLTRKNLANQGRGSESLTQLEHDVLRGVTRGQTNKDIARDLGLNEVNVKMHVRSICSKLSVKNRTQIAMTAVMQGLL